MGDTSGHERGTALWIASSVEAAAKSRSGLVVSVAAAIGAMLGGMPALLLAIPALFTALFTVAFLDGRRRQAALCRARDLPIRLPEMETFCDTRARALVARLARARVSLREVTRSAPRGAGFDLKSTLAQVSRLERDAVVVLSRFDYLSDFIESHPFGDLRSELQRMRARVPRDDAARAALDSAIARCAARLEAVAALNGDADRLLIAAEELVGTLEQVPVDIVRLQVKRFERCDDAAAAVRARASGVLDDLAALERVLDDDQDVLACEEVACEEFAAS
ncbi:MAG TPA: hypothetical protein VHL80_03470 [Polyangia bacterium]|nr:hypothetical protein [Polyangia bacterium]